MNRILVFFSFIIFSSTVQCQGKEVLVTNDAILLYDIKFKTSEIAVLNSMILIDIYSKGIKTDSIDLGHSINDFKFNHKKNKNELLVLSVKGTSANNEQYFLSKFVKSEQQYKMSKQIQLEGVFFNINIQDDYIMLIGKDSLLLIDWELKSVFKYDISISSVLSKRKNGLYVLDDQHVNIYFLSYKNSNNVQMIFKGKNDSFPIAINNNQIICRTGSKIQRISIQNNEVFSEEGLPFEFQGTLWFYSSNSGSLLYRNREGIYSISLHKKVQFDQLKIHYSDFLGFKYHDGFLYYIDEFVLKRVKRV